MPVLKTPTFVSWHIVPQDRLKIQSSNSEFKGHKDAEPPCCCVPQGRIIFPHISDCDNRRCSGHILAAFPTVYLSKIRRGAMDIPLEDNILKAGTILYAPVTGLSRLEAGWLNPL